MKVSTAIIFFLAMFFVKIFNWFSYVWRGAGTAILAGFDDFYRLSGAVLGPILGGFQQVGALLVAGAWLLGGLLAPGIAG